MKTISEPLSPHNWHRQRRHRRKFTARVIEKASARVKSSLFFMIFQQPSMHSVCFFFSFGGAYLSTALRTSASSREGVTSVFYIPWHLVTLTSTLALSGLVSWQVHSVIHIWLLSLYIDLLSLACYLRYILHYDYHHSTILIIIK